MGQVESHGDALRSIVVRHEGTGSFRGPVVTWHVTGPVTEASS